MQTDNYYDWECEMFRLLLLYNHEHIGRFSKLRYCTFKFDFCDGEKHVLTLS